MKKSLRFASAALAVALAASCAAPAFAAGGSSFTKSETVYAVMNADGSIQSTTVSEHVYSASGLSKVTDQSTLTNIQNTESSAEFTQDGEKLVWNTDDTDVYYKGDTDRALPIQATVTYALDGQEAALEDLIGKSGHLTMTIALKNNETGTVNVNGTDRTIVTPLVTAVGVIFGQDATNVVAAHGLVESAAKSNVAAFVTLPGVKDSLSGLLPDELDTIEDYLQDTITVEADVTGLTCPQVMMACATNAAALGTDNVFDLSSLNDLTDGINQLNDAMSQLLDGASQLEDGTTQLRSGVLALLDGANTLNNGAAALDKGLGQLTNGLDTLSANNSALNSGAQQVADGVLASANKTLKEGGLIDTDMTWDNYAAVIDNILTMNDKTLAAGRRKMVRTIWEQAPSFKDSQLDLALYLSATKTNHDLEAALHLMQNYDPSMLCGLVQLLTSQEAKDTAKAELKYQVENSQDIADVRALKDSLSKIQYFVSSVGQYTAGVQTAADGAHSAKDGSAQLAAGTKTLYDGVNTLSDGASQLNDGTHQLNDGLNQFNEEGISKLTGALDQDQLHGLKTVLDEMTDRLENYPGFPEGVGGPELMAAFAEQAARFGLETRYAGVDKIDLANRRLFFGGEQIQARALILALGASARRLGVPGEAENIGRGVSYCATCDGMLYRGKPVAVVGYTDTARQEAEFLQKIGCSVTYFDRPKQCEIRGDGRVESVTCDGRTIPAEGVFILRPTMAPTELFPGLAVEQGYVTVDRRMATNLPGLFAAGDCTGGPLQVSKAAGDGLIAGQSAAAWAAAQERREKQS